MTPDEAAEAAVDFVYAPARRARTSMLTGGARREPDRPPGYAARPKARSNGLDR